MSLITAYRPTKWDDVIGQNNAVKTLSAAIENRRAQVFALCGPSGTGKTTLARIAAAVIGCKANDLIEVDAATHSGIEKMRDIQNTMLYRTVNGGPRVAIVDEAHGLSKQAWDSLLKATEEPKAGAFWFLCTTNPAKIPKTMLTRCARIDLKPVSEKDLRELVYRVADGEKLAIGEGAIDGVVAAAEGSPRQALSYLVVCADAQTRKEAMALIQQSEESVPVLDLCRFLAKPGSIGALTKILEDLKEENPEGVRIQVVNYFGKVAMNAKNQNGFLDACDILGAFSAPYNTSEGFGPLMLSIANARVFE